MDMRGESFPATGKSQLSFFLGGFCVNLLARLLAEARPVDMRIALIFR
jgi:hypothetical protein